jgi:hypothetical protein
MYVSNSLTEQLSNTLFNRRMLPRRLWLKLLPLSLWKTCFWIMMVAWICKLDSICKFAHTLLI